MFQANDTSTAVKGDPTCEIDVQPKNNTKQLHVHLECWSLSFWDDAGSPQTWHNEATNAAGDPHLEYYYSFHFPLRL